MYPVRGATFCGLCYAIVISVASLAAAAQTPQAKFDEAMSRYVQETQALAVNLFVEARGQLPSAEMNRLGALSVGLGVAFSGGIGTQCHVAGNLAYTTQISPQTWQLWLCSEGLQAVTDVTMASLLVALDIKRANGERFFDLLRGASNDRNNRLAREVARFYVDHYIEALSHGVADKYFDGTRCLGDEVFYMVITSDTSTCSRSRPNARRVKAARERAESLLGAAWREINGDVDKPPSIFEEFRGIVFESVVDFLIRHEIAHLVVKDADLSPSLDKQRLLLAEVEADRHALSSIVDAKALFTGVAVAYMHEFWKQLAEVKRGPVGVGGADSRQQSLGIALCERLEAEKNAKSDVGFRIPKEALAHLPCRR